MSTEIEKLIFYSGEVMLTNWSDNSHRGRTVTFRIGEDEDSHPFREHKTSTRKTAGQRYQMVLVELGDDEKPVEKTPSQLAFLLCKNEQFWHFINERSFVVVDSEEGARSYILEACGVDSRSKLDTNPTARRHWEVMIWEPFQRHRRTVDSNLL